ncbi:MAG: phosphatase PAP2 family protein, partial [Cellulomonadaceae bacterium]|nr:phosphatase PAP2 family protein [Cellulomonadaceae bacterium]
RRRVVLALQVAVLMGGANLTTQVLKHVVLSRPDLALDDSLRNTLPSGHTTAAASVAAALVLVVPRRVRPAAALVGAAYTVATGISTLVGGWHRPSDVVAAVLVVLGWAGLATALGARGTLPPGSPHPRETAVVASTLVLAGLTAGVLAAVALERTTAAIETGLDSTAALLTAYGGGSLGVGAVVSLAFGTLLAMRAAADPRPAHAGPSSRTVDRRS